MGKDSSTMKDFHLSFGYVLPHANKQNLQMRNVDNRAFPQSGLCVMEGNTLLSYYDLNVEDVLVDYLQLGFFAENQRKIKGTFEASFVLDSVSNLDPNAESRIEIKNGYFETMIFQ